MHCHYCDREADLSVERDGVTVWLCDEHFRERLEELSDAERYEHLLDEL
jgi:ribosomal protein L37AE/L43A